MTTWPKTKKTIQRRCYAFDGLFLSSYGKLLRSLNRYARAWGMSGSLARRKKLKKTDVNSILACCSFFNFYWILSRCLLNYVWVSFFLFFSKTKKLTKNKTNEKQTHTVRILWVVLKGEIEAPRILAIPSSIPWSNSLLCCWWPEDDESTSGLRNLKVRSGPSTTIESLTKSFLKEKLVERLAPIVPCNWAVVWNGQRIYE